MYKRLLTSVGLWALLAGPLPAAAPLKALIVDGQNNHDWKATTPLLKQQLVQTSLFDVDVATTPPQMSDFRPKFGDYRVVVMNYTGADWPAETNKALEEYMAGGGGMVVFHAASSAFPKWKEYNRMIGLGGWGGRDEKSGPWVYWKDGQIVRDTSPGPGGYHTGSPMQVHVRVPGHPVTKGLPEKFMHDPGDELYNRLRGPAENLTVLATALSPADKSGSGREEPVLMAIDYGKGRVFHTVLGHGPEHLRSVAFIVTFQRGAEWAATGKVTQQLPDDFPTADKASMRK